MNEVPRNMLGTPVKTYFGIADTPDQVKSSFEALRRSGLSKDAIVIYSGSEDKDAFVDSDIGFGEATDFNKGVRQIFASDEVKREARYREAIEKGKFVIQAEVDNDDQRADIEDILKDNNIQDITYFGQGSFETIAS